MGKFAGQVKDLVIQVKQFTSKEVAKLTLDVHSLLRTTTPKDTSWAANNWVPQIGSPYTEVVGSRETPNDGVTSNQAALTNILATYNTNRGSIFITNNVPYIVPLNNGHSGQAPAGFVQFSLLIAIQDAVRGSNRSIAII